MLSVKAFVGHMNVDVWWAVEYICLEFQEEVGCGFEDHRKAEGLQLGRFSARLHCCSCVSCMGKQK